jgi:hypothetical protein
MSEGTDVGGGAEPLVAVANAAGERLRAETDDDTAGATTAADSLMHAATAAMGAGYSLRDIAAAEARGQDAVRNELRADALRGVDRTGRQVRDAEKAHHDAIGRATRLGLSTREIAHAAGVTHGTIRAITQRRAEQDTVSGPVRGNGGETGTTG